KASMLPINITLKLYVDGGYQCVLKFHQCCELPKKSSKHNPLSDEDKLSNREKAKIRIIVEHVNAKLKVFKIFSTQYRNRRKDFLKRFNIVCALVNADMGF
ncbi:MAG: transposase, partial [Fusobacteria bacterium]|nr:transposase [Fusobacteriota bacterium]